MNRNLPVEFRLNDVLPPSVSDTPSNVTAGHWYESLRGSSIELKLCRPVILDVIDDAVMPVSASSGSDQIGTKIYRTADEHTARRDILSYGIRLTLYG